MVNPPGMLAGNADNDAVISFVDIINFLADFWKKLLLAGLVGAILGLGGWFFLSNYHAELPLSNSDGISLIDLRSLQQTLPNLAGEIVEKDQAPQDQLALYRAMSSPDWWKKAITPIFSLTKADIKDLGAEMEKGSNNILFLVVDGSASSKEVAIQNAHSTSQFIRSGGAYLGIKTMLKSQESDLQTADTEIQGKINTSLVELDYQQARLKNLEALAKRFPGESRTFSQIVDPKDSGAKYLPISTQLVATNTDINNSTESLARLKDRRIQLSILKRWLEGATPIFAASYDGLQISRDLLALEEKLRSEIKPDDPRAFAFVDSLRNSLIANEARFKWGLVEARTVTVNRVGMIKSIAGGLIGVLLLTLLVLVGQKAWSNIKSGVAK